MKVLSWSLIFIGFLWFCYQFIGKNPDLGRASSVRQKGIVENRQAIPLDASGLATLKPRQLDGTTRIKVNQLLEATSDFDPWQEYLDRLANVAPYLAALAEDRPEKVRTMRDMRELLQMELDKAWHGDRRIRVLLLGHSVLGWVSPQIWPPGTFDRSLAGSTFADMRHRLSEVRDFEIETIVLMGGIAELMEQDSMAAIVNDYNRLLDEIARTYPHARVIVFPTLPIGTRQEIEAGGKDFENLLEVSNIEIEALNQQLYQTTVDLDRGMNIVFLGQVYDYFIGNRGYAKYDRDGLHLSHEGAAMLGVFVSESLRINSTLGGLDYSPFQDSKQWVK